MKSISETRKEVYVKEIAGWDWDSIVSQAKNNLFREDDNVIGSCFLHSYLSTPSGKIYTPFACSNVTPCPHCKGEGGVTNLNSNPEKYAKFKIEYEKHVRGVITEYGMYSDRLWPEEVKDDMATRQQYLGSLQPILTCPFCDGLGSEEVRLDELYNEALEEVANDYGGYIQAEGGGTYFFCINVEISRDVIFQEKDGYYRNGNLEASTEQELIRLFWSEGLCPVYKDNGYGELVKVHFEFEPIDIMQSLWETHWLWSALADSGEMSKGVQLKDLENLDKEMATRIDNYPNKCPCCMQAASSNFVIDCRQCPIWDDSVSCETPSNDSSLGNFTDWVFSTTQRDKRNAAKVIADMAKENYDLLYDIGYRWGDRGSIEE